MSNVTVSCFVISGYIPTRGRPTYYGQKPEIQSIDARQGVFLFLTGSALANHQSGCDAARCASPSTVLSVLPRDAHRDLPPVRGPPTCHVYEWGQERPRESISVQFSVDRLQLCYAAAFLLSSAGRHRRWQASFVRPRPMHRTSCAR